MIMERDKDIDITCSPFSLQNLRCQPPQCSGGQKKHEDRKDQLSPNLMSREPVTAGKDAVHRRTREVLLPTHRAVVLTEGTVQLDTSPLARGELGLPDVSDRARL